jgi:hypothetical protein
MAQEFTDFENKQVVGSDVDRGNFLGTMIRRSMYDLSNNPPRLVFLVSER